MKKSITENIQVNKMETKYRVSAIDPTKGTVSLENENEEISLKASDKVKPYLKSYKVGQQVEATHNGTWLNFIKPVGGFKPKAKVQPEDDLEPVESLAQRPVQEPEERHEQKVKYWEDRDRKIARMNATTAASQVYAATLATHKEAVRIEPEAIVALAKRLEKFNTEGV